MSNGRKQTKKLKQTGILIKVQDTFFTGGYEAVLIKVLIETTIIIIIE